MPPINPENIFAVWRANAMPQLVIADVDQGIAQINSFADADFVLDLEGVAKLASQFDKGRIIRTIRSYIRPFESYLFVSVEDSKPVACVTVQAVSKVDAASCAHLHFERASLVLLSSVDDFNALANSMLNTLEGQDKRGLLDLRSQ